MGWGCGKKIGGCLILRGAFAASREPCPKGWRLVSVLDSDKSVICLLVILLVCDRTIRAV